MALTQKELEKQLTEAGNKLLSPPSSITELISTLDRVESLLSRVEQSPSESMRKALSPSMKALIANELLRHSDIDVKVSVASCISEITRITAPDAPYEDDEMKEVFQLVVSSFENLDDRSSPSYIKRTSILEIVAKVRSCVVMLDLECDDLIAEMFQHFFRSIRSEHPENVFSSMETIMTLVLEESEDASVDLVSLILNVLKTENKDVLPVARQLAEKVIEKSVIKIKPCLEKAMESLHTTQDDYPKAVANILKEGNDATDTRDADAASKNVADGNDVANESSEKAVEVAMETMDDAPPSEEVGPTAVGSPKSVVSGTIQKEIEDTSAGNDNAKETNNEPHGEEAEPGKTNEEAELGKTNEEAEPGKTTEEAESGKSNEETEPGKTNEEAEPGKTKVENSGAEKLTKSRTKKGKGNKRKGKKAKPKKRSSEPSEPPIIDEKEGVASPEIHEKDDKDGKAQNESPVVDTAEPAEKEKESEAPVPLPKTSDEPIDAPSPSPSGSVADEDASKKVDSGEKIDELMEDVSAGDLELKESDGKKSAEEGSVSEPKSHKRTGKKVPSATDKEDTAPSSADVSKNEDEKTSELDAKSAKQSGKKVQIGSQREDRKKRVQGKVTPTKDLAKSPSKDEGKKSVGSVKTAAEPAKDEGDVEKESHSNSKRKRSSEKKAPKSGDELVGSKVQVWWPDDKKYYTGVVAHFDPSNGKHKVTYDDGDVEVLNLAKEKWKLIADGPVSGQEPSSDGGSVDAITETPKAKKAKSPAVGAKQGKTEASAKKGGASSSKSKATPKSGTKQKEENKSGGKSKDVTIRSLYKSGENKSGKNKDSKSSNTTPKSAAKSKDNEPEPSKGSNKSKQETPKSAPKSKAKTPKSGGKSSGNSKAKAASSAENEERESSPEPVKTPESSKRKSGSNSNKSSKKTKRSTKG